MDAFGSWARGFRAMSAGDFARAHDHYRRSIELARRISHWQIVGIAEASHGFLYFLEGDLTAARALTEQSVESFRRINYREGLAHCLQGLAMVAAASGEPRRAAEALAAAEAVRMLLGVPFSGPYGAAFEGLRDRLKEELGDQFAAAWAAGQATDLYAALDAALQTTDQRQS